MLAINAVISAGGGMAGMNQLCLYFIVKPSFNIDIAWRARNEHP